MNNKKLQNIPPPLDDADAVNKIYTDTLSDETRRYVGSVTPFVNQQNKYAATNNINMREFTPQNVGDPASPKDVATKEYVDRAGGGGFEARNGGYTGGNKVGGIREPKKYGEAANKKYVDTYVEKYVDVYVEKFKMKKKFLFHPQVNMAGNKLSGLPLPSPLDGAASKEYAGRVEVYARAHADKVGVDRSTELL